MESVRSVRTAAPGSSPQGHTDEAFLQSFGAFTGGHIATSTDLTDAGVLGGDWQLEKRGDQTRLTAEAAGEPRR
jgi:hypothetical protein